MDDTNGIVDFSAVLTAKECGIFEALNDQVSFGQARLELGVVTWPNGADVGAAWMYEAVRMDKLWTVHF
jgi:hypothetical protein